MAVTIKNFNKPKACFWIYKKDGKEIRCPLLSRSNDCHFQRGTYRTWEEQYANCPLEEVEGIK